MYKIELLEGRDWLFRKSSWWRIRHENGNILLTSETYHNKTDCEQIAHNFYRNMSTENLKWLGWISK